MSAEVYKGEMQLAGWRETNTGGATVTFWLPDPSALDAFRRLTSRKKGMAGQVLAAMIVEVDEDGDGQPQTKASSQIVGPYSQHAGALRLSGFFLTPLVWHAVGTDEQFLAWLRTVKCAARNTTGIPCHGDVVAAHVRRIADGAGTGIKPQFSAIPLCDCHHQLQHQKGEGAFGGKEWFDKQRVAYVQAWCWETLKKTLGFESWKDVSPQILREWCVDRAIALTNLPECYR